MECKCSREAHRVALEFGFPMSQVAVTECDQCARKRAEFSFEERRRQREEAARAAFLERPEDERWDDLFDFMYGQGWRP